MFLVKDLEEMRFYKERKIIVFGIFAEKGKCNYFNKVEKEFATVS